MIYTRHDFIELVRAQPEELQSLLLALIWHASQGNPNHIAGERLGLCGITLEQAKNRDPLIKDKLELLDPETNIILTADYIVTFNLIEFLGFELANQAVDILRLAEIISRVKREGTFIQS